MSKSGIFISITSITVLNSNNLAQESKKEMKIITTNKKAYFDYNILETVEAGIVLTGDEIKSIRNNHISLGESFATAHDGEMFLLNAYIGPYSHAYEKKDTSRRSRKLLLNKKEISKMIGAVSRRGLTLVPTKAYFGSRGYVKIEIALAKHKLAGDKRQSIRERDLDREAHRAVKGAW